MAGHGWGGKTRKKKIQGRVVALEDSKRTKKAPARAQGKTLKKHEEKYFFMKSAFPLKFSTTFGPDGLKNHDRLDSKLKSINILLKTMIY